jgi:hypothetical protein
LWHVIVSPLNTRIENAAGTKVRPRIEHIMAGTCEVSLTEVTGPEVQSLTGLQRNLLRILRAGTRRLSCTFA